jgi:type I restriction enzyme S subunit
MGDILVNSTGVGTLGRVAQVLGVDEPTIVDSHVTVVRANP